MLTNWCEEVLDGFGSWADVEEILRGGWYELRDDGSGLWLLHGSKELVVVEPRDGRAQQRRALHRAGFRRPPRAFDRVWSWAPPEPPLPAAEPGLRTMSSTSARLRAAMEARAREHELDRLRTDMALRVAREIYRCAAARITVTVPGDDEETDDWLDDEDDDEALL